MSKLLDIATELFDIEKYEANVKDNPQGKYVPVSKVRYLAHELIVEIRKQEAIDKEVLGHMERAEKILRGLNVIGAKDGS